MAYGITLATMVALGNIMEFLFFKDFLVGYRCTWKGSKDITIMIISYPILSSTTFCDIYSLMMFNVLEGFQISPALWRGRRCQCSSRRQPWRSTLTWAPGKFWHTPVTHSKVHCKNRTGAYASNVVIMVYMYIYIVIYGVYNICTYIYIMVYHNYVLCILSWYIY